MADYSETWKMLESNKVYAYPSANASDGGDVNSEKNITNISWNLIEKSFVIKKRDAINTPLKVTPHLTENMGFSIATGSCIINGYYVESKQGIAGQLNDFLGSFNTNVFVSQFKSVTTDYYHKENNVWVPNIGVDPLEHPIPKLHVVFKLVKDNTGNIRGDFVEVTSEGLQTVCEGVVWSVLTDEQVAELKNTDTPFIDLAYIFVSVNNASQIIGIDYIETPVSLYSYIDIAAICHGDMSFKEYTDQVARLQHSYEVLQTDYDGLERHFGELARLLNPAYADVKSLWNLIYPIGSIYIDATGKVTPSEIFEGTVWEQLQNCFLLASGIRLEGATGGTETVTLTSNQMPSHTHEQNQHRHTLNNSQGEMMQSQARGWATESGKAHFVNVLKSDSASVDNRYVPYVDNSAGAWIEYPNLSGTTNTIATNQFTGGGQPHDNMPPYVVVKVWKRIA